jgi:hypothetical protein
MERRKDAKEILSRGDKLTEQEGQIRTGITVAPSKKVNKLSREAELLDLQIQLNQKRINALARSKVESAGTKLVREGTGTIRMLRLGMDFGALLRQGLFGISNPKGYAASVKRAAQAIRSDAHLLEVENALRTREINGKLAEPLRRRAGLSRSDAISDPEEAFLARWVKKIPGFGKLSGTLERGQTAFLNSIRTEMFDAFAKRHADATDKELSDWANYINSATGRSATFGAKRSVPDWLSVVMTSPRYETSRWEMVGNIVKAATGPTAIKAIRGDKAARATLTNLGATVGTIYGALKMAEAAGYEVDFDPRSSDFFKIRSGDTVIDPTAGISPRIRTAARLVMMAVTGESSFNSNPQKELGKAADRSLSPAIKTPYEVRTGKTFSGFDKEEDEMGWNAVLPLIIAGFRQNYEEDGPASAVGKAGMEFVGIGVNSYPKANPKKP